MVARSLPSVSQLTAPPPCPPLSLVIAWRKRADAMLSVWSEEMSQAMLAPKEVEESALELVRSLRQDLRTAEVFPPTQAERHRRRQDAMVWASEICRAAALDREPVLAVRRVIRLWIATGQQAAISGSAAAFAA